MQIFIRLVVGTSILERRCVNYSSSCSASRNGCKSKFGCNTDLDIEKQWTEKGFEYNLRLTLEISWKKYCRQVAATIQHWRAETRIFFISPLLSALMETTTQDVKQEEVNRRVVHGTWWYRKTLVSSPDCRKHRSSYLRQCPPNSPNDVGAVRIFNITQIMTSK